MATTTLLHRIREVRVGSDFTLALTWDDGSTATVDLAPLIEQGGVFATLADPDVFARVALDPSGRYISWLGDIDVCADALRLADGVLISPPGGTAQ
jgi:hypothetical protein